MVITLIMNTMNVRDRMIIIFLLTTVTLVAQQKEEIALNCINNRLEMNGKNIDYIVKAVDDYNSLLQSMDEEKFREKQKEVDLILTQSGFYNNGRLNYSVLKNCISASSDQDTSSSYHKLAQHISYLSENEELIKELSPQLQLEALSLIVTPELNEIKFYKVVSFILFQGIIKEFENYAQSKKEEEIVLSEADESIEYGERLYIVEDEVEIEFEAFTEPEPEPEPDIFIVVENMPEFPGGKKELQKYLQIKSSDFNGKVFLRFVIDPEGKAINPTVTQGLNVEADKIAVELIHKMPKWKPGAQRGRKVHVRLMYPVEFK